MKYVGYLNRVGDVAEAVGIYEPAWEGIENYIEGVFWDENVLGQIPDPQTPVGYRWARWIKLGGEDAPLIYYTYEPLPEPEETQVQRLNRQIAEQEVRLGDVEIMLADVVMGGGD